MSQYRIPLTHILVHIFSIKFLLAVINFSFPIQRIPNVLLRKTTDPLAWDFHSTYHGTIPVRKPSSYYNHLVPWPRYFDLIIDNKAKCGNFPCVFQVREISNATKTLTVLVSNEQHDYFVDSILPFFEHRWLRDGSQIIAVMRVSYSIFRQWRSIRHFEEQSNCPCK